MTAKFKILVLFLTIPLTLTGCFGGEEDAGNIEVGAGKKLYEDPNFSIVIPDDWETITRADFTSNVPGSTVVAFRNNIRHEDFTANLSVSHNILEKEISLADFANSVMSRQKNSLLSFNQVSNEEDIYTFEGKQNASDPIVRFRQRFAVSGKSGFIVTAAYISDEDENVVNELQEMLDSFSLK